nr:MULTISPECIES: hypothetical protein [Vibrio]
MKVVYGKLVCAALTP